MKQISWQKLTSALTMSELGASASECHGVICGLICGGINLDDNSWSSAFNDLMNDGMALPADLKQLLNELFATSASAFSAGDYEVKLLLADDDQYLNEVAKSLAQWTESFMAGFAVGNGANKKLPKEINEALSDLSQISQIDTNIEDDEQSERIFEEVVEYVRLSAMMCFAEMGAKPKPVVNKKLH